MTVSIMIPDALLEPLHALAARSGHSIDDVASELLSSLVSETRQPSSSTSEQAAKECEPEGLVPWTALRDEFRAGRHTGKRHPVRITVEDTAFLYPSPTARLSFMDDYLSLRLDCRAPCFGCANRGTRRLLEPLWIETLDPSGEVIITFSAVCDGCNQESNVILLLGREGCVLTRTPEQTWAIS